MTETNTNKEFKPYIPASSTVAEFTVKSILLGAIFGVIFGAATVYLALKAGLTVSASIPIAVLAISIGRKFFKTTILENNIIQTTGSAGESIAAGVVFTLPGFLFLSAGSNSESFFSYWPIFLLAALGGILGTLMMIPLRKSLIVDEHGSLPYPEGTACASVLIAGEKGGDFAKTAYYGLAFAFAYAILQKVFHLIAEAPAWATAQTNRFFPSATVNGEITPEYLGVGYIIGPKIAGVLVAGGVLAWLGLIPLLATLVPAETIAYQLVKLGYLKDVYTSGGPGTWDPLNMVFTNTATAVYQAYVKQIGAGAVAAGGFITLLKTIPTIVSSFKSSLASINKNSAEKQLTRRTDNDLSFRIVIFGSLALVLLMAVLPQIPGDTILNKLLIGVLVIVFGFFFVTVSSRIVGLIGTSSNPVSGMTIATLMGTCLIFISIGWTGQLYEPMALVVGSMICIAAANAGATSQDLKTGYIVGATPKYQQMALFVGAIVSAVVIGATLSILDRPTAEMASQGIKHAIGTETYPAPQGTLMATLIKGLLSFNLDWQFVLVGVFLAVTIELCGVKSLSFAVGAYLPLSTTLPIFAGGALKGLVDMKNKKKDKAAEDDELGKGNLFATGLVAGGALMGVIYAFLMAFESTGSPVGRLNMEEHLTKTLGSGGYQVLGFLFFLFMGWSLYRIATAKEK
ncbi:OPT/YSL family transporter [Daejeonella sp. H1SJ63]|uniref:OPT family oligopeptide transporter n=1 Tax=Daejeonella sp. H1SJ63 TaxID=3034145 RepID=UPI0023EBCE3B|nr:OPT/YSL family transporter [Daejeonella sp. H1SJ63]